MGLGRGEACVLLTLINRGHGVILLSILINHIAVGLDSRVVHEVDSRLARNFNGRLDLLTIHVLRGLWRHRRLLVWVVGCVGIEI